MFKLKRLVLLIAVVGLSGCGLLPDPGDIIPWETESELSGDYENAIEADAITVPEDLDSGAIQQMYSIPRVAVNLAIPVTGKVPRPAPLTAGSQLDAVRLQRLGESRWAVVNVAPGQLWPQVRAFLVRSRIDVASVDASKGLIDTAFVMFENRNLESRFRFRVDSGAAKHVRATRATTKCCTGFRPHDGHRALMILSWSKRCYVTLLSSLRIVLSRLLFP